MHRTLNVLIAIVGIYFFFLVLIYVFQRQLTYLPSPAVSTPEQAGVPEMEIVELHTADGLTLNAWYRSPTRPFKPTIVFFHGNTGHIGNRGLIARPFLDNGYGFLLVTYRGYSGNPGSPSEEGLYNDGRAAMEFLEQKNTPLSCIVLYGNSIGTAVAVQLATEYPVAALVLQSSLTSLTDVARYHYLIFTFETLVKDKFASIDKVEKLDLPIFLFHGEDDRIIPPKLSRRMYEKIKEPKQLLIVPARGHNTLFEPEAVIQFIQEHVKCQQSDS
jgi:uncharacterized protein